MSSGDSILSMMAEDPDSIMSDPLDFLESNKWEDGTMIKEDYGLRTDPVYKVSSVTISTTSLLPCDVYGSITIIDIITNKLCVIFQRGRDDADPITSENDCLTFTTSEGDAMYMHKPQIYIDLKAKGKGMVNDDDDVSISKGFMPLAEINGDELLEQKLFVTIPGDEGHSCCVYYLLFPFGVIADLELRLTPKGDTSWFRECGNYGQRNKIKVYGKITAYHVPDYGWNGVQECSDETGTELFTRSETHSLTVSVGSPIKLDKSLVVVPACSSLRIEVCLVKSLKCGSNEVLFEDEVVFNECGHREITLPGEEFDLYLNVEWVAPFDLDKHQGDKRSLRVGISSELLANSDKIYGSKLVEVLSVCIFRENDAPLSLYGNITYMDKLANRVYDRNLDNPQLLAQGDRYLSLTSPLETIPNSEHFIFFLKLKDVLGRLAIAGYVSRIFELSCSRLAHWFDRPLCSIIRGDHGFAAVHYTAFSSAVKACVRVFYCKKGDPNCDVGVVHGVLTATYGECHPLESFSKKCCRIVLFEGSFNPCEGSEIKLCRPMIASPLNRALLIHFNLYANSKSGEPLCNTAKFLPSADASSKEFTGPDFGVRIDVQWSRADMDHFL